MRRVLLATVLVTVAVAAWWLLAPRQLPGGSASYVVPSGSSMQPLLDHDDLVVTRAASGYGVGDVIAFRSDALDRIILHRIVRIDGDRYVTKGDNNEWVDRDRPSDADVLGRMVLRMPGGGAALEWFRTPSNAAVVGTVAAVLVMGGAGVRRRRSRRRRSSAAPPPVASAPRPARRASLRPVAAGLAAATLTLGAATTYLHLRPSTRSVPTRAPYQHTGEFGYVAVAEPGAVYPDGKVDAGEPVFLKVADMVAVRFVYRFSSDRPHEVAGTVGMTAHLEDGTGWRRTFEVQAPGAFTGSEGVASGTLDLGRIGELIREVETATEIPRPTYTLWLRPSVDIEGTVAGRPVTDRYSPSLMFEASSLLLRLPDPEPPADDRTDALRVEGNGAVVVTDRLPNPVVIGPFTLDPVRTARLTLVATGLAALALLFVVVVALRRPRDEAARIHARYGQRIVPVAGGALEGPVVDVATIGALVRVADSYERMILHDEASGRYLVEGDVALYRYQVGAAEAPTVLDEAEPEEDGPSFLDEPPETDTRFLDETAPTPAATPDGEADGEARSPAEPAVADPAPVGTDWEAEPAGSVWEGETVASMPSAAEVIPTTPGAHGSTHGVPAWPALPPDDETRWTPEPPEEEPEDGEYWWMAEDADAADEADDPVPRRTDVAQDFFLR